MSKRIEADFEKKYNIISSKGDRGPRDFYYAVKTTGIFCVPGCSSRLPRRENVIFYDTAGEAIQRGYRPCKRCRPMARDANDNANLVTAVCRMIEDSIVEPTLSQLSEKTGYSQGHLQKSFKKATGISPREYAAAIKANRFRKGLDSEATVTSSIYNAGFGSSSRVYEKIDSMLAMTPTQYRNCGKGITMHMGVFSCFLGKVLIALTEKGVTAVELGDKEESLKSSFRERFKKARIEELSIEDDGIVQSVLRKIGNPAIDLEIPMDIHGTVFQQRVWSALRVIPAGEKRTYTEIAEAIGSPRSVRAVANACAGNNIAILIPCHRVIRKNGQASGYRWGRNRKEKLLQMESE